MALTYPRILKTGLQSNYNALLTKDETVLYFCTDSGKIYKGSTDFTNSIIVAGSKPSTPIMGKIYVLADSNTVEFYTGTAWKVISYPITSSIDIGSDDLHVASAKAVYDAIQEAISGFADSKDSVKSLKAGSNNATLTLVKGDDSESSVIVPGVVTTPIWNETTRKLTLPVSDGTSVEVNIGKDIFLDPSANNRYDANSKSIIIYLNDGTDSSESTEIIIPAADLIDVYTGTNTTSAITTVSDDNKISVSIVLNPDTENAIKLTDQGLMVNLSAYAKLDEVNGQIDSVRTIAQNAYTEAGKNTTAIEIINGSETTSGSIKKIVKDSTDPLIAEDARMGTRITNLEAASAITNENVSALADASTTWGSF